MGNIGVSGIVRMVVVGLIVGILARFFYPGAVHMSIILTAVLGIVGSFLAGLIGAMLHRESGEGFHPAGFIYSVLGAILVIFLARHVLHLGY
jgi:uncharacterized membrane protein YeaQ/YmgE (transglycosylase-associated protein family)